MYFTSIKQKLTNFYPIAVKSLRGRIMNYFQRHGFKSKHHCLPAAEQQIVSLTALNLNFFICKVRVIVINLIRLFLYNPCTLSKCYNYCQQKYNLEKNYYFKMHTILIISWYMQRPNDYGVHLKLTSYINYNSILNA